MTTIAEKPSRTQRHLSTGIAARVAQIAIMFGLLGGALFLAAGRWDWMWAWVMLGIYVATVAANATAMRHHPEAIAERGQPGQATQSWDKLIGGLWGLAQFLLLPVVAGLDVRFGWSPALSDAWHWIGAVAFALGLALFSWAMVTNAYFSTAVRIQTDRGQTVCRAGPYQWLRHPGYSGAIIQSLGMPLLLGSGWAFLPALAAAGLMIIRTDLEDQLLQAQLPGYQAYARDVPFRLLPFVW